LLDFFFLYELYYDERIHERQICKLISENFIWER